MATKYLLTCEHAGNQVPTEYMYLFEGKEEELFSHKAIDFGALRLAKHLEAEIGFPLFYTTTSRLLVENNRSLNSESLFSEFSKGLSEKEKQQVLDAYYFPHRNKVEQFIQKETEEGHLVVHWAVHTFTPAMEGEVREAGIGILFDPERPSEKTVADALKKALTSENPERKVQFNSPYPGKDDGLPTYLRTKFPSERYAGFELEVNQKFFLDGEPQVWQDVMKEITAAIAALASNS